VRTTEQIVRRLRVPGWRELETLIQPRTDTAHRVLFCTLNAVTTCNFEEAVDALCGKMAEEKDPDKLALLKQQLRQLFLESDTDSEEETRRANGRSLDR
jgi:hypothetical protein